jgi:hypothetical protein
MGWVASEMEYMVCFFFFAIFTESLYQQFGVVEIFRKQEAC